MAEAPEVPFRYDAGDRVQTTTGRPGTVTGRFRNPIGTPKIVVTLDSWEGRATQYGVLYDQCCLDPESLLSRIIPDDDDQECEGHPCEDAADQFPHAGIGEVFYCDGSCRG